MKFDTFTSTINEKKDSGITCMLDARQVNLREKPGDKNYPKTLNVEQTYKESIFVTMIRNVNQYQKDIK